MQKGTWEKLIFILLSLLCVASLLLVLFLVCHYLHDRDQMMQEAKKYAEQEAIRAAKQIDNELSQLMRLSKSIANDLSSGKLKRERLVDSLKRTIEANPKLFGLGVAYVPYVNDLRFRLSSPYYINKYGKQQIEKQQLIQAFTTPFYHPHLSNASPRRQRSISSPLNGSLFTPNSTSQNRTTGVVFIDYSLDDVKYLMDSLDLEKTGYGFILSREGVFICHPIDEVVKSRTTIFDMAKDLDNDDLRTMGEKAIKGESGVIDLVDEVTDQWSWIFFEPIRSTGWSMGTVFIKDKIPLNTEILRRQLIQIVIGVIAFLLFLSSLLFRANKDNASSHTVGTE